MMRRGRYSGSRRRRFVCHRCGATPSWQAAEQHRQNCTGTKKNRHREDRK